MLAHAARPPSTARPPSSTSSNPKNTKGNPTLAEMMAAAGRPLPEPRNKSPTLPANPASTEASANAARASRPGDLRPSYTPSPGSGPSNNNSRDLPHRYPYSNPSSTSQTQSQPPSHSHQHPSGPHHHHHHHHHVHSHSPAAGTAPSASANASKDQPVPARPESAASSSTNRTSAGLGTPRPAPLSAAEIAMRDRNSAQLKMQEAREKEQQDQRAREAREAAAKATSPRTSTAPTPSSANPYPRPSLPPSPTNSRTLGVPPSASPSSSTRPSPSLPPASAPATGSNQRPNLPLPSLSAIGGRSLPSPFDPSRDRPPSTANQPGPGHHRTGSTGSNVGARPDPLGTASAAKPDPSRAAVRPMQQGSNAPGSGSQALPPIPSRPLGSRPGSEASRYPGAAPLSAHEQEAARASTAPGAKPPANAPATAGPANRPPNRDYYGGNYPFSSGFMPFSGGFDYPGRDPFGSGWTSRRPMTERERMQKDVDERRKLAAEQDARAAKEKAAAAARRDQEMREQQARRDQEAEAKAKAQRDLAAAYDPYRQNDTALQQVAPRREPRPYEYKTDARDYQYTPRDKRPRMDAAVDDARRGNANKSRRRKEEDRQKSPVKAPDLSYLTEAVRKWPEVHSTAVETWLKTLGELDRVVANEIYTGNKYRMSQHRKRNTLGGLVQVRIGGGFLGQRWKVRGEVGWDEATSTPKWTDDEVGRGDGEISAGWRERGLWGTDVYTDDSDLGLVLIHAGWVKWGGPVTSDTDSVVVDVRIVPPLGRYFPTERNGVRSRGWGNGHDGGSIVIEAVRRVPIDKSLLAGPKNRKRRLAELALQRDHVFGVDCLPRHVAVEDRTPLADEMRRINGVYDSTDPILTFERDGAAFKFTPAALETMLVVNEEADAPLSLWSRDLELDSGGDRYRLSLLPSSIDEPSLRLIHTPLHPTSTKLDENKRSIVFEDLPSYCLAWTEDGLAFWQSSSDSDLVEPRLCRVSGYRWIKRDLEWQATAVTMEVDA